MTRLIGRCVLPLTIIAIHMFTKWWFVLPEDAPDSMLAGFPLPFICDGWGTSMSLQIFVLEFIVDLIIYFLASLLIVFLLYRYASFRPGKVIITTIWSLAGLMIVLTAFWLSIISVYVQPKRDFKMKVIETGYKIPWLEKRRPELPQNIRLWNQ